MSNLSIKERKVKFQKLSNDLYIQLIKGYRKFFLYMKNYWKILIKSLIINNNKKANSFLLWVTF